MKILVVYDLPREGFKALTDAGHELFFPKETLFSGEELLDRLTDADVVVSVFTQPFTAEHIDAAAHLKLIANYGVGFNTIDVEYATKHGITVTNTPDPVIEPTAELAMTLMLALSRKITELDRKIRIENGLKWGIMENLGDSLQNKTLGIIGMGNIGQSLARRALANGMNIIYYNRHKLDPLIEKQYHAKYVDQNTLLTDADYISLNAPYTRETHHILNKAAFEKMKPTVYIVNTARGPLIDEVALAEALKTGRIAGAGLDVFENEPDIHADLLNLENVIMVPHVGTGTIDTRIEIGKCVSKNILNFLNGKGEIDKVN
ncbi:NAD(P)-dependent oxidoreductase [Saccharicrinis sp. FJH54]|uniref:NAD(P)-dependent oxidoreductase n=1 Tax=Saccharicrinis sp. FJH54 TaxID=3344665 RepID=UPI0035D4A42F